MTKSSSLTIRFETEKKTPTIGRPSKSAAQNPKAGTIESQGSAKNKGSRTLRTYPDSAISVPRRTSQSQVSSSFWPRSTANLRVSKPPPIEYGTRAKAVTNRLMKIRAGSKRLEIRRYEDADKGVDLDRIQEYCVGNPDQASGRSKTDPRRGIRRKMPTHFYGRRTGQQSRLARRPNRAW